MDVDLQGEPYSRPGCWMSIAVVAAGRASALGVGLYLRNNHCRGIARRDLFRLELTRGSRPVPFTVSRDPAGVTMRAKSGRGYARLFLEAPGTLRVRGRGTGLVFHAVIGPGVVAHPSGEDRWVVNLRPSLRRYGVERIAGNVALKAKWAPDQCKSISVRCEPAGRGDFEIAVDEFLSVWTPPRRKSFAAAAAEHKAEFVAFAAPLGRSSADRMAARLLYACTKSPCGFLRRRAVFMSLNWMDQVWSWDNCFNAAALAEADPDLAMEQFMVVADHQDEWGAFPDGLNDGFKHYNYSKPPVQGALLNWLRRYVPTFETRGRTRELYPPVAAFTEFWLKHRRWPGSGLCHYLHGNDSGWDNSTVFDAGAPLVSPDLNAFLVEQTTWLAKAAGDLGRPREKRHWLDVGERLLASLVRELWTGDGFRAKVMPSGLPVSSRSLVTLMPLVICDRLEAEVGRQLCERVRAFVTPHGLATEEPTSAKYTADGYWRGPVWGPTTLLIVMGLEKAGETSLWRRIARGYCQTCRRSGFAENFDAKNGKPLRDPAYTWTASSMLCLERMLKGHPTTGRSR